MSPRLRSTPRALGAVLLLGAACVPELSLPPGARITCREARDCPPGFECDPLAALCVQPGDTAPLVVVQGVGGAGRPVAEVPVQLVVSSSSTGPLGFTLEFATDCGGTGSLSAFGPGTLTTGQQAAAPPADGAWALSWSALADAAAGGSALVQARVDTTGDGVPEREGVADCARVRVRVRAEDALGLTSGWAESGDFALGNTAPEVLQLEVLGGVAKGNTIVRLAARDEAADPVGLFALELSAAGDFSDAIELLQVGRFPVGGLDGVIATPSGATAHDLVWDSSSPLALDAPAARLRVRVKDALGAVSALTASPPFVIDNTNSPPVLRVTSVSPPQVASSGGLVADEDVLVCYTVGDADGDLVSVATEVALGASGFVPAFISSEADPLNPQGQCQRWNRIQAGLGLTSVRLRLTPADGAAAGERTELGPFTLDTRPRAAPSILDLRVHLSSTGLSGPAVVPVSYRLVDPASDLGAVAFEYSLDNGARWIVCREYPAAESEGGAGLFTAPLGATPAQGGVSHLFLWDATGLAWQPGAALLRLRASDGRDPGETVAQVNLPGTVGSPGPPLVASSPAAGGQPQSVAAGDYNADGVTDLAVANGGADGGVSILLGRAADGGAGAGTFAPRVSYPAGTDARSVSVGDFDTDGITDLAVVGGGVDGGITILLGQGAAGLGDGTFAPGVTYPAGSGSSSVTVADFDADGITDLAVANAGSNSVSILLGQGSAGVGDGTFAPSGAFPTGAGPTSLTSRDFNGDGITDLAVANSSGNSVSILLGRGSAGAGDGTFASSGSYPAGTSPQAVAAGDFDGDGVLDLAVASSTSNDLSILFGRGDGTFAPRVAYAAGTWPRSVTVGDFNADGLSDLAVANQSTNDLVILLGQGAGGGGAFAAGVSVSVGNVPSAVIAADFNADGISDLAVANSSSNTLSILLSQGGGGTGVGTFAPRSDYSTGRPIAAAAGDFNADGITDLAVANQVDDTLSILLGRGSGGAGDGTFTPRVDYPTAPNGRSVTTGDFNADGITDLVVASYSTARVVSVLLGQGAAGVGDGTFAPKVDYPTASEARSVTMGDFNADGITDLATANFGDTVSILLGQGSGGRGDGTFATRVDYPMSTRPISVTTGDFNADGILDLAVAHESFSGTVSILLGQGTGGAGDGTFAPRVDYLAGLNPNAITTGDFNSDGITDLAVANGFSSSVSILRGQGTGGRGDGTFAARVDYSTGGGSGPRALTAGDFNADGITDLAVANELTSNVAVLLGRGAGTFAPWVGYSAGSRPFFVTAADFNADGVTDLAVANINSGDVSILLGQHGGLQAFTTRLVVAPGVPAAEVTASSVVARFDWPDAPRASGGPGAFPLSLHLDQRAPPAPIGKRPLTAAYRVEGDRRLRRIAAGGAPGAGHLRLENRLGARSTPGSPEELDREGLRLAPTCGAERALLVNLPLARGQSGAGALSVRLTTTDWVRASELACSGAVPPPARSPCTPQDVLPACDPFGAEPEAARSLPRLARCEGGLVRYDDVVLRRQETVELPRDLDADLSTGCGPRFVIDTTNPARRVVQVLTDRLGTFQGFVE